MRKLTIIVNCTDRKSVPPEDGLRARSLPSADLDARFGAWSHKIQGASQRVPLLGLYQGEAWLQAKGLAKDARAQGFEVRMLVASAGLGLRDVTSSGPAYSATFASRQQDSVVDEPQYLSDWWGKLTHLPLSTRLRPHRTDATLLVLSESYARAMDSDLISLGRYGGDHLLVGGWRDVEGLNRLPADRDLRQTLGGTVSSLCLRMARRWLLTRSTADLCTTRDFADWSRWATRERKVENYQRSPKSDLEIVGIIQTLVASDPSLTATRALRQLRGSGIACEQKRFGSLFKDVMGTT